MKIEILPQELFDYIYKECLRVDFRLSEVKPYEKIMEYINQDMYECYGFYENDELIAYAFLLRDNQNKVIYLDYLAVLAHHRKKGYGNIIIDVLFDEFKKDYKYILAEVENPEYSENESDLLTREGRVSYYVKNGFKVSDVKSRVLDDNYKIIYLLLNDEVSNNEIVDYMKNLYVKLFGTEYYNKNIEVKNI